MLEEIKMAEDDNGQENKNNKIGNDEKRRVILFNLQANPNVGLFIAANDKHAFCGLHLNESQKKSVHNILGCEIIQLSIAGIPYPGIFMLFDEDRIIVPQIIFPGEKRKLEKLGYKVEILETRHTALRNNIVIHKKKALVSKETDDATKKGLEKLGFEVLRMGVSEFESIGNLIVMEGDSGFAALAFNDNQIMQLKKFFNADIASGTVNNRNLYVSSSIVINSHGILIGSDTMPDEVMDITDVFNA